MRKTRLELEFLLVGAADCGIERGHLGLQSRHRLHHPLNLIGQTAIVLDAKSCQFILNLVQIFFRLVLFVLHELGGLEGLVGAVADVGVDEPARQVLHHSLREVPV